MKKSIISILLLVSLMMQLSVQVYANTTLNNNGRYEHHNKDKDDECDKKEKEKEKDKCDKKDKNEKKDKENKKDCSESGNITELLLKDTKFKTLSKALEAGGLVEVLKGDGPFTVFAPTDDAFKKLPEDVLANLLKPENKEALECILKYHVYPGKLCASDVVKLDGKTIKMSNGEEVKIQVKDKSVYINNAKVTTTDINAKNGVIHVIDTVIVPEK